MAIVAYTTLTNFSTKYLMMCKVYTDVGGIKLLNHVCPPVRKIIHSLKLVDYLHVHAENPWYNYHLAQDPPTSFLFSANQLQEKDHIQRGIFSITHTFVRLIPITRWEEMAVRNVNFTKFIFIIRTLDKTVIRISTQNDVNFKF